MRAWPLLAAIMCALVAVSAAAQVVVRWRQNEPPPTVWWEFWSGPASDTLYLTVQRVSATPEPFFTYNTIFPSEAVGTPMRARACNTTGCSDWSNWMPWPTATRTQTPTLTPTATPTTTPTKAGSPPRAPVLL